MTKFLRTNSSSADFKQLINELDYDLTLRNGEKQAKFAEFNTVDKINWVVIAMQDNTPIACGGFKITNNMAEIKRMYVKPLFRGKHIGQQLLVELENWAKEIGLNSAILETGVNQIEAQNLYKKLGYLIIPNYGPYVTFNDSICMQKLLI